MNSIPDVDPQVPENAVRVYGQDDGMDDFPVLKAFQQYIDAEQAKARKRMLILCSFFGFLMVVVIAVFVALLMNASARNQSLNDRLVEYAMRDRDRGSSGSAVVVQPPQDMSAIVTLTTRLEEMQKKLAENQEAAQKAAVAAAERAKAEAAKPKAPSPEEIEIKRLKSLLAAEQEKNSAEKAKQHQAEIEAYRRKHYPELYEDEDDVIDEESAYRSRKRQPTTIRKRAARKVLRSDDEVDALLDDIKAIRYFEDDESEADEPAPKRQASPKNNYSIPVDVKGSSSEWSIPLD